MHKYGAQEHKLSKIKKFTEMVKIPENREELMNYALEQGWKSARPGPAPAALENSTTAHGPTFFSKIWKLNLHEILLEFFDL